MEIILGILFVLILGAFTWATSVMKEETNKEEDTEENNDQKQ